MTKYSIYLGIDHDNDTFLVFEIYSSRYAKYYGKYLDGDYHKDTESFDSWLGNLKEIIRL